MRSAEVVIQSITSIAVIAGLGLVVWELQQNREAATAQLTSDGFMYTSAVNQTVMGEDTANVLAKACDNPEDLTRADYYVLDNYYLEILARFRRITFLQQRTSLYDDASFEVGLGLGNLFDSAPGRAYLKRAAERDTVVGDVLRTKIENWNGETCTEYFGEWQKGVERELATSR